MYKFATQPASELEEVFKETAADRGLKPGVIEKDFWVCWLLGLMYGDDHLKKHLKFKGGTSLSKVYHLIERFSEDIDLLIDVDEISDEPLVADRSKGQQKKFSKKLRESGLKYLQDVFLPKLVDMTAGVCSAEIVEDTTNQIKVLYPCAFEEGSLLPYILLEIGPMGAWTPSESKSIISFAAEQYPNLFDISKCEVETIIAERTFWEKITILHGNAHRSKNKPVPTRHSRHYYDIHQMHLCGTSSNAIDDISLMRNVMEFKRQIYPQNWAGDLNLKPGSFKLIPPEHINKTLLNDYDEMEEMFFGKAPSWDEIVISITELESEINNL